MMLDDTTRLQYTVEQVLRAGVAGQRRKLMHRAPVDLGALGRGMHRDDAAAPSSARRRGGAGVGGAGRGDDGGRRRRRTAHGHRQPARQRREVLGRRRCASAVELASPSPDTVWVRVQRSRRRHPAPAAAPHLQPLLPLPGPRVQRQGHRARASTSCGRSRGSTAAGCLPRARAKDAARPSRWSCPSSCRGRPHEPHPDRRGRAAPGRRAALQPGGRRARRATSSATAARRWRGCATSATPTTPWCSTSCCRARTASTWRATLRAESDFVPILMLTARGPARRRARGLRERRRRLPAEAVRAGDSAWRGCAGCCGASSGCAGRCRARPASRPCRRRRRPRCSSSPATASTCGRSNCTPTTAPTG